MAPIYDEAFNRILEEPAWFRGFVAAELARFPHDIYSFFIQSIRDADAAEGQLLLRRWLAAAQDEFEALYARIGALRTLADPEAAPVDALPFLKWIVGFTAALDHVTGGLADDDLRRLISIAVRTWKFVGTGVGETEPPAVLSGGQVVRRDWFWFQNAVGDVEVGVGGRPGDLWVLDPPGMAVAVPPEVVTVDRVTSGAALPSTEGWAYVNEGLVEGTAFQAVVLPDSTERAVREMCSGMPVVAATAEGGRYLSPEPVGPAASAEVGARWLFNAQNELGEDALIQGRPWHLRLRDGVREYVLTWSDTEVALEDAAGVVKVGPRPRRLSPATVYAVRLRKDGAGVVRAAFDGLDVFGPVTATLFGVEALPGHGFGYVNRGLAQSWVCYWVAVGPPATYELTLDALLGATEAVPHPVRVRHVSRRVTAEAESFWRGGRNRCRVVGQFGLPTPLRVPGVGDLRVGVDPAEFCSDLRLACPVTTRDLVERVVGLVRPSGERVFVRFPDFLDRFRRSLEWTAVTGTATLVAADGYVDLEDAAFATSLVTDVDGDDAWEKVQAEVRLEPRDADAGKWVEVRFHYLDELNFHALRLDPRTRLLTLEAVVAGVRAVLATATRLDVVRVGTPHRFEVQTEDLGGGSTRLVGLLDGDALVTADDATVTPTGKLGVACAAGQRARVRFAELYQAPLDWRRVGP